ncbi:glucose-6-phosphate isomerase [Taklimakanibacter albus]|uniref:Glucose-6-phosphate isomerase n=1 Tax=Taklimakanibacter albus TaxID=2800327 RepID=A0ACC5RF75_9HYPH|nr:glucose-6-phosphate isomerase [Aestuariivirga sp. YIM B02566]MBK1871146.1 glucose-6-phosphate isomerase [Aestuariivirga sp. YIM B02566]
MTVSKRALDALMQHRAKKPLRDMRQVFNDDPLRFKHFSLSLNDLLLDWSKCAVTNETMKLLRELAVASDVTGKRDQMFAGELINTSEQRAVLHIALRNRSNRPIRVDGKDVMPEVNHVLTQMRDFATGVRSGAIATAGGKRITDVVNIGIGGSDLGPAMTVLALAPYHDGPRLHFVSNVDGAHLADTLKTLDPARTLFLIASKTFTTIETMTNAHSARDWIVKHLGEMAVAKHFAAISTALDKVKAFGIGEERTFGFWDWVGGRYSVWSAIGLPLMIAIGPENFAHFLSGAHEMDEHFRITPIEQNLPITLGLIGVWHRNICAYATRAVIPYDQRLARLPAYLQQLDMESNGKGVERDGTPAETQTGPVVWGEPGTNGQHAFFQLIHQGTSVIPVEFLIGAQSHEPGLPIHHDLLMANCLAQSEALMRGRTLAEAKSQVLAQGKSDAEATRLAPHRVFTGDRPSLTIAYRKLDPQTLGRLVALYEHRVFTEAAIWNINAFDQWGVELGKELATGLLPIVEGKEDASARDASTQGLVAHLRGLR